jgi:hypothetical protein
MGSLCSQFKSLQTGKAGSDLSGSLFPFIETADSATLKAALARSGSLSAEILLGFAVANLLARTVTPQRLCACGCGASVTGKARCALPACRKRLERERKRTAAPLGRHFNLLLQGEMPFKVKPKPVTVEQARNPRKSAHK